MSAGVFDLLVPPRCAACRAPARGPLCARCEECVGALVLPGGGIEALDHGVVAMGLWAYAGVVADIVRGCKDGGRHAPARALGARMRVALDVPEPWQVPTTWVPSPPRRRRTRGVEVPRLLAGPGAVRLLAAVDERRDQTALDAAARRQNPIGAFRTLGRVPRAVVLVDDVRTTGATALAAATVLRAAGARRVLVATLAVGGDDARAAAQDTRAGC